MTFIPLSEWSGINDNNGILYQSLGTDQFIVAGVVDNVDNTGLASGTLRSPGKITGVQTQGPVLGVATAGAHIVDSLWAKLML